MTMTATMSGTMTAPVPLPRPSQLAIGQLSDREREVLALMAGGCSNYGICRRLFLSPKTVESHVRSILTRLDIPPDPDHHRRVLAVLGYLGTGGAPSAWPAVETNHKGWGT